jgi:hypothetical protein
MKELALFKPEIEQFGDRFVLTAPNQIREKVWNYLGLVYDLHIFDKSGGVRTQITLDVNPGASVSTTYALLTSATYVALVQVQYKTGLNDLWLTSNDAHIKGMSNHIELNVQIPLDPEEAIEGLHIVLVDLVEKPVRSWKSQLDGRNLDPDVVRDWINKNEDAYRRLQFVDRTKVKMSRAESTVVDCKSAKTTWPLWKSFLKQSRN